MTQIEMFPTATSSQRATRASPFHLPGSAEAQKMTDISGHTYFPLFKPNDPLGAFSKMFMGMSLWASTRCYLTWNVKPTPSGRSLFQLVPQTLRTDATEFGSSPETWPTPTASQRGSRSEDLIVNRSTVQRRESGQQRGMDLQTAAKMWPTPRACSEMAAENIHNRVNDKNPNLETVVARTMWPTPQASDNRDQGCMEDPSIQRRIKIGKQIGLTTAVKETRSSGSLNPQWVEWLMGYPEGWTDLED